MASECMRPNIGLRFGGLAASIVQISSVLNTTLPRSRLWHMPNATYHKPKRGNDNDPGAGRAQLVRGFPYAPQCVLNQA